MNYDETIDYLYHQMPEYQRIGDKAYKEGLGNSLALDRIFDHPHRQYRTIHVGGTNGKGSVSHLLASILQESGYKTGLYTSPHLVDFRERIKVNGEMIDKRFVVDFVEQYREQFETVMPSFFELTMEMAFLYFAQKKVDVAVIEVGLGGRLDSTNIILPELSVITNIGFDHMKFLGNTLPKIAAEKAGIIKPFTPVVIGEMGCTDVAQVFIDKAQTESAPIVFSELYMSNFNARHERGRWIFRTDGYPEVRGALNGPAQEKNARTVLTSVEILKEIGFDLPMGSVLQGFAGVTRNTSLQGRWQQLQDTPRVICDIAHNAHGLRYITQQLQEEPYRHLRIIFGMAADKDVDSVLSLLPGEATYYFTQASVERAMNVNKLADKAEAAGLKGNRYPTVAAAVAAAKENADKEDLLFIGGSSFVVADALPLFP